ncbi:hypothetical protein C8T65DRAFT_643785 [Cerioporus squamosus]|nr:hypothetical protein C8T65DRAFT_643785 [Cerioporus squamosus]
MWPTPRFRWNPEWARYRRSLCSTCRALIEPHLVYGCEAALDVRLPSLASLLTVQTIYIRRTLGLRPCSSTIPLYTESGIWPLHYRRPILALRWLVCVLRDRDPIGGQHHRNLRQFCKARFERMQQPLKLSLFCRP